MRVGQMKTPAGMQDQAGAENQNQHQNNNTAAHDERKGEITWGATPDDWHHFDRVLGLGGDLLPVVSNPDAPISPDSTMKEKGKTPSRYDSRRQVMGIAGWPTKDISGQSLARWSREPDFGICIRTTSVRGLDVDITDPVVAQKVREFIQSELGLSLPCRSRGNSPKFLHPFRLEGEYGKRVIFCEGNNKIEFLMNGQMFVAIGTHPSGSRYEWEGGLPEAIPELTPEQFEGLFDRLQGRFGKREPAISGAPNRVNGADLDIDDPILTFMDGQGLVLGQQANGSLVVQCPWEHEHTQGETGDGSTVYYPAGVNGRESAGFKCLHGHCEGRKLPDYLEAIGYAATATDDDLADGDDEPQVERKKDSKGELVPYVYDISGLTAPEFILDDFISTGLCVIAGAPGVGKTSLLIPLAAAVAHLYESELQPELRRKVVYISEAVAQAESVLYGLSKVQGARPHEFREWFTLMESRRRTPEHLGKLVAKLVREKTVTHESGYSVAPLIVLDTSNANIEIDNESDNALVGKAIAAIKENLGSGGLWLVAHTAKALKRADVSEMSARGASAFSGDANQTCFVFAEEGIKDKRYMAIDKHRFEASFRELEFTTHTQAETVTTKWGTTRAVRYRVGVPARSDSETRIAARAEVQKQAKVERTTQRTMEFSAKVLEFIKENGPSTATAIEGAITGKSEDIRKAIVGLRDSGGLIVSGRKGRGELLTIGTDWDVIDQNAPVESDLSDA